jgi:hypothetical protein
MARQPEVEPWPPLNDASKLAYLESADNTTTFNFSCIFDLVEFYKIALTLLAARMKCYGCGGMKHVVFPASFS